MDWGFIVAVMCTGLVVVFVVLIFLVLFVQAFGAIVSRIVNKIQQGRQKKKDESKAVVTAPKNKVQKAEVQPATPMVQNGIPNEVVAAISAAVAMLSEPGRQYAVRSVKRTRQARPAWGVAGITENTRPF